MEDYAGINANAPPEAHFPQRYAETARLLGQRRARRISATMTTRQMATAAQPRADLSANSTALVARKLLDTYAKQLAETPSSLATRHVTTAAPTPGCR
jgi:hypothetical protein